VKLLVSSDYHPDYEMMGVSRYDEVTEALTQTANVAIREQVDWYICLGDVANPDSGNAWKAVAFFGQLIVAMSKHGIRTAVIAGNHDVWTDGSGATTLTPLKMLEKVEHEGRQIAHIVERPKNIRLDDETALLCLPYTAPSHSYDVEEVTKSLWKANEKISIRTIVASHLMVPGIHPGSETKDMPRGRNIQYPVGVTKNTFMRLQGHYHKRQIFDLGDGGPKLRIPGSLCRLAFGEEDNEPSFFLIEF